LAKELEELADQTLEEELLTTKTATSILPAVPQKSKYFVRDFSTLIAPVTTASAPAKKVVNEDAELDELAAMMN
jgi:hypothetical protein